MKHTLAAEPQRPGFSPEAWGENCSSGASGFYSHVAGVGKDEWLTLFVNGIGE